MATETLTERDRELVAAIASTMVEDMAKWVPGWDGPIPTAGDWWHDVCDANMVAHEAMDAHGIDGLSDEGHRLWMPVWEAFRDDPRTDFDASPETVDAYHSALWGS